MALAAWRRQPVCEDRKSTRLNSSHGYISTLSLHDALPISTAGTKLSFRCPTNRFPVFESDLEIWELPREDYSAIVPCYETFAKKYSGMNIRREEQWRWQLGGDNRFAKIGRAHV